MEATKKKKAYLKPEMSRLEVKAEKFIASSFKDVIIDPEIKKEIGLLSPQCTKGGNYKQIGPGDYIIFPCNKDDIGTCDIFQKTGVKPGDCVKVTFLNEGINAGKYLAQGVEGPC